MGCPMSIGLWFSNWEKLNQCLGTISCYFDPTTRKTRRYDFSTKLLIPSLDPSCQTLWRGWGYPNLAWMPDDCRLTPSICVEAFSAGHLLSKGGSIGSNSGTYSTESSIWTLVDTTEGLTSLGVFSAVPAKSTFEGSRIPSLIKLIELLIRRKSRDTISELQRYAHLR